MVASGVEEVGEDGKILWILSVVVALSLTCLRASVFGERNCRDAQKDDTVEAEAKARQG